MYQVQPTTAKPRTRFQPPIPYFRCRETGTLLFYPHMWPSERVRSDLRENAGEYTTGIDCIDFAWMKKYGNHNVSDRCYVDRFQVYAEVLEYQVPIEQTNPFFFLPPKCRDKLYHEIKVSSSLKVSTKEQCAICSAHQAAVPVPETLCLSGKLRVPSEEDSHSVLSHHITECGHFFHEACLFAWLLQDRDMLQVPQVEHCNSCQGIKDFVANMWWTPEQLETALGRLDSEIENGESVLLVDK
ncbi:hypothetical protein K504DRAFT_537492 [Pleomassaria siparia CBS 279.74]|uniref:RING-type domain-containing protein n=1 Tax=Pleomassaria siparia CBS 279.74 TaxID=1314801 RepID=A0A6G1JWI3_9PLEO|nr:hypothetical protein K504DRAFT_537492 [Pleomassaria siparia CBS 279.74]